MSEQDLTTVALDGALEISMAAELSQRFRAALTAARPIELDVAALERVDGAGLQLLAAFLREARRQQLPCRWRGAPTRLIEAAALLGVAELLPPADVHS